MSLPLEYSFKGSVLFLILLNREVLTVLGFTIVSFIRLDLESKTSSSITSYFEVMSLVCAGISSAGVKLYFGKVISQPVSFTD